MWCSRCVGGLWRGVAEWMMRPNRHLWWIWFVLQFLSSKWSSSARKVQLIPLLLWLKQELYENSREHGPNCVFLELCLRPRISNLPSVMQLPSEIWEDDFWKRQWPVVCETLLNWHWVLPFSSLAQLRCRYWEVNQQPESVSVTEFSPYVTYGPFRLSKLFLQKVKWVPLIKGLAIPFQLFSSEQSP